MENNKKGSVSSKKMTAQACDNKSAKKSNKLKKRKSKKKLTGKDIPHEKGSTSPQSPDDHPSATSDNPDVESDSTSLKDLKVGVKSSNAITRFTTSLKQHNPTKSPVEVGAKPVTHLQSSSNTKLKKLQQSSQSSRLKDSLSQGSVSSKSSKSSCNISTNSSKIGDNQSVSRTQMDGDSDRKKEILNESLRWDDKRDDPEEENERIKQYKLNRRKRYLAAANQKYSEWVKTLSGSTHSLSSNSEYNTSSTNNSSHDNLLKSSSSSTSAAYIKTISSATIKEGLVSGLAPNMSIHRGSSQVMLNC